MGVNQIVFVQIDILNSILMLKFQLIILFPINYFNFDL